jgi:hypothetical protein
LEELENELNTKSLKASDYDETHIEGTGERRDSWNGGSVGSESVRGGRNTSVEPKSSGYDSSGRPIWDDTDCGASGSD